MQFKSLSIILLGILLGLVNAQTSTRNSAQPSASAPPVAPGCDPTLDFCDNADCSRCPGGGDPGNCIGTDKFSLLEYYSPNSRIFNYLEGKINITWSFKPPFNGRQYIGRRGNYIYYQRLDDIKWTFLTNVSASTFTYIWNLKGSLLLPANYRIRVLPDNIDQSGALGRPVNCLPEGFPAGGAVLFRLLPIPDIQYNPNKDSAGFSNPITGSLLIGLIVLTLLIVM